MRTLLLLSALACNEDAPECPACPACPEPAAASTDGTDGTRLEPWEAELLGDQIRDMREGVRPLDERGWGLCTGTRKCADFLGTDVGELKPGSYLLRAELAVPRLGEGWSVRLDSACTTTRPDGSSSTNETSKTYSVTYAGADRGYRLEPLFRIESPGARGAKACTASMTPIRPDGTAGEPWPAAWTVPAKGD